MTPAQLSKNLTPSTGAVLVSYTVTNDDWALFADATAGSLTITLPNANIHAGRIFFVKKTDSSVNTVTVSTGGGTIDGSASVIISSQYGDIFVISDGTNYHTVAVSAGGGGGTGGSVLAQTTKTANYNVTDADYAVLGNAPAATPITITLPTAVGRLGRIFTVKKLNSPVADTVTVASAGGTIDGVATRVLRIQYTSLTMQSDGADWWII
jgi:hypothetical protein